MGPRKDEGAALEIAIVTEELFWRQIREEVREVRKKEKPFLFNGNLSIEFFIQTNCLYIFQ